MSVNLGSVVFKNSQPNEKLGSEIVTYQVLQTHPLIFARSKKLLPRDWLAVMEKGLAIIDEEMAFWQSEEVLRLQAEFAKNI